MSFPLRNLQNSLVHFHSRWKDSAWGRFSIEIVLTVLLCLSAIFAGFFANSRELIEAELVTRARAHFNGIVLMRSWNARHGGIFAEKKPGEESNPYLVNPDITGRDGKVYTKKNPALMTREMSELAKESGAFQFHITSLKLRNPDNAPDQFERDALVEFENGLKEKFGKFEEKGRQYFRYMAPLRIEQACLACHDDQGYKVGDVRGGISVSFEISDVERAVTRNAILAWTLFALSCVLVLAVIFRSMRRLHGKLLEAQRVISEMAITDDLTHLRNRRFAVARLGEEFQRAKRYGQPLTVILCDIDYFKRINDNYGHAAGDQVLINFAKLLLRETRASDIVARWGGEEFLFLLPNVGQTEGVQLAEKLRIAIAALAISIEGRDAPISITVSFGIATWDKNSPVEQEMALIDLADNSLYRAKAMGRNCVVGA